MTKFIFDFDTAVDFLSVDGYCGRFLNIREDQIGRKLMQSNLKLFVSSQTVSK